MLVFPKYILSVSSTVWEIYNLSLQTDIHFSLIFLLYSLKDTNKFKLVDVLKMVSAVGIYKTVSVQQQQRLKVDHINICLMLISGVRTHHEGGELWCRCGL